MMDEFATLDLADAPVVRAPDGSAVRPLCALAGRGSFAHFQLAPGEVSTAVSHATVEEIWYIVGGTGEMWRRQGGRESTVALRPGICLTIPLGTTFQFRAAPDGEPLAAVAVTMPPWPVDSPDEARPEPGPWTRPTDIDGPVGLAIQGPEPEKSRCIDSLTHPISFS
jgi:mannose-6-phosphate isomerase-like protein (cupin superfamily)